MASPPGPGPELTHIIGQHNSQIAQCPNMMPRALANVASEARTLVLHTTENHSPKLDMNAAYPRQVPTSGGTANRLSPPQKNASPQIAASQAAPQRTLPMAPTHLPAR